VKLHSEEISEIKDTNQTIVQIIFAITKVTVERPVVIIYSKGKGEYSSLFEGRGGGGVGEFI
jgi:hypothetical protein